MHACVIAELENQIVEDEVDKPVEFTKSKAFNARPTWQPPPRRPRPKSQTFSIYISLSCFMIYFFWLREENELDEELSTSLYSRVVGLEKATVLNRIRYADIFPGSIKVFRANFTVLQLGFNLNPVIILFGNRYNERNGLDTAALETRLKELIDEEEVKENAS